MVQEKSNVNPFDIDSIGYFVWSFFDFMEMLENVIPFSLNGIYKDELHKITTSELESINRFILTSYIKITGYRDEFYEWLYVRKKMYYITKQPNLA